jgi:phosphoribosylamine--glycine ligase
MSAGSSVPPEKRKTVLVVGSGGREHALAWKLSCSSQVARVCVAPGNPGMAPEWERWPFGGDRERDFAALAERALREKVDLVVVGPDNPLADGLVDVLESRGLKAFGPSAAAARIEASKAFAKEVMAAAGVPTAKYWAVDSLEEARKILRSAPWGAGWVIKADGLALGKGVRVCDSLDEALNACAELMPVSKRLVIEERLSGEEISWLALCDGQGCALLEPARDYKRVGDGDRGPNTGGMGAFSPVPGVPASWAARVREEVFGRTLAEMRRRGTPFRGVLYAGLMADFARDRYWVLEFNARFGDPETQALMPRIEGDILPWFEACATSGGLEGLPAQVPFAREAAVYVVGAARGYPDSPEKGRAIVGLRGSGSQGGRGCKDGYFCAGVAAKDGAWVTSGGRVFGALGMGADLGAARTQAYARLESVRFEGMHFRRDVAAGATTAAAAAGPGGRS